MSGKEGGGEGSSIYLVKPLYMGGNVVGEHAPIRSASLVNTIQVYAVL